jgi:putative ABC transport system ATP-binding protein
MSKFTFAISLRDVLFGYEPKNPVLDIPSFDVPAGKRVFLHGPSGSGKTTFLSLISGVVKPQTGNVKVFGNDLTRLSVSARDTLRGSKMGYIFQGFNLIPYLTVAENIALPCELYVERRKGMIADSISDEVRRIATRLDIETKLSSQPTQLSTGQQQRVAIARAIIGSPSLVIADEPTSALDMGRREAFLALLTEAVLEAGSTLLFVSHDASLASQFDASVPLASINLLTKTVGA